MSFLFYCSDLTKTYFIAFLSSSSQEIAFDFIDEICWVFFPFSINSSYYLFFKDFIYLFMRDTQRERHRHRQRVKQAPGREPDAGLDPRPQDHTLSQRQILNRWATQASRFFLLSLCFVFKSYFIVSFSFCFCCVVPPLPFISK